MSMQAIGVYVRELRTQSGLTQEELACKVGLSEKSIRNLEKGAHEPKLTKLAEIVMLVRGSAAHLARLMDPSASPELATQLVASMTDAELDEAIAILERLRDDPPALARWLGYGEALTKETSGPHVPDKERSASG